MVCRSHRTSLKHYSLFLLGQLYHTLEKHEDIDDENALYAKPVKKGKVLIIFIYVYLHHVQLTGTCNINNNTILQTKFCTSYKSFL